MKYYSREYIHLFYLLLKKTDIESAIQLLKIHNFEIQSVNEMGAIFWYFTIIFF